MSAVYLTTLGALWGGSGININAVEVGADGCQEIVDEFIRFMRGCSFMDVNIYSAMENAVEEHTCYQAHLAKAIESGLYEPIGK